MIGEAAANTQRHFPQFATEHPSFPLKAAYGMRNALAHGYFRIDLQDVWNAVVLDLPQLKNQVSDAIQTLPTDGGIMNSDEKPAES